MLGLIVQQVGTVIRWVWLRNKRVTEKRNPFLSIAQERNG